MRGLGNLGGMGSMGGMMKQVQKAIEQMQQIEAELAGMRMEGSAGGGMVKAEVTGKGQLESVTIDPEVVDPGDVEMLQDLVVSAVREALEKAEKIKGERVKQLTGGMGGFPGMF